MSEQPVTIREWLLVKIAGNRTVLLNADITGATHYYRHRDPKIIVRNCYFWEAQPKPGRDPQLHSTDSGEAS